MTDHDLYTNLHRRMDTQDAMTAHIATEKEVKPAIDELVALWKGSQD